MTKPAIWWEVWVQHYDTFATGEWVLHTRVEHEKVADLIIDSLNGWGTRSEKRGGPEPHEDPWARLTADEFRARYILIHGKAFDRNSPDGREFVRREAEEIERKRIRNEVANLPGVRQGKIEEPS